MPAESETSEAVSHTSLAESQAVPEFFVEGYGGATLREGVVKLAFLSVGHDPASHRSWQETRVRLAIPLADLRDLVRELTDLLDDLKAEESDGEETTR